MKQAFFILWLAALTASVSLSKPQAAATKKTPVSAAAQVPARSTTKAPVRSTAASPAGQTAARKASPRTAARSTKKGSLPRTPVRARQLTPTADRYREIQEALAARGYLQQEPNGVWDARSADALGQFQTETNLTPTGKISSLTIIGLGLGPKFSDAPVVVPPPVAPPAATPQVTAPPAPDPQP